MSSPSKFASEWSVQAEWRQKCRTDLLFLCNKVIGYTDVCTKVHGPLIDRLQKFKGGTDELRSDGSIVYKPFVDIWDLDGSRRNLYLDPRGHLKTTIITQAHVIQWILNYPDIRILITTATGDLAEKVLRAIKAPFQFNDKFRFLFNDFCPPEGRSGDWGNMESFTVLARRNTTLREPTCSTSSVGKVIAGSHYEVLKCSDMVDKENVKTPGGIRDVIDHFRYMDPLLERHESSTGPKRGWTDVEGTRYDFGDLYGTIIDNNTSDLPDSDRWQIHQRSAELNVTEKVTLWPNRFSWSELKAMERTMGPQLYSAQMLNSPVPASGGLATLEDLKNQFIPRREITAMLPSLNLHVTVDMAAMDAKREGGDYIVLTCAGFDRQGRMIVIDVRRGHFNETETIDQFYLLARLYPKILDFKIEKEAYWRTLAPFLKREQFKRGWLPPMVDIKRDNATSKEQRIRGLQPWFAANLIYFAADLPCMTDLFQEITRFPSRGVHDDILDTLADQLQNWKGGVNPDVVPAPWEPKVGQTKPEWEQDNPFAGFDPITREATFIRDRVESPGQNYDLNGI